jgi:hypothetical protein
VAGVQVVQQNPSTSPDSHGEADDSIFPHLYFTPIASKQGDKMYPGKSHRILLVSTAGDRSALQSPSSRWQHAGVVVRHWINARKGQK